MTPVTTPVPAPMSCRVRPVVFGAMLPVSVSVPAVDVDPRVAAAAR